MAFWDGRPASASHLRLFEPTQGWRAHDDVLDGEGRTTAQGSCRSVELAVHNALNAGNLILLTGAGSSYCAKSASGTTAPSMVDLWNAVEAATTPTKFNEIIGLIPTAANLKKNIEKLLTLCKLYAALFNDANAEKIAKFVVIAEKAIHYCSKQSTDGRDHIRQLRSIQRGRAADSSGLRDSCARLRAVGARRNILRRRCAVSRPVR